MLASLKNKIKYRKVGILLFFILLSFFSFGVSINSAQAQATPTSPAAAPASGSGSTGKCTLASVVNPSDWPSCAAATVAALAAMLASVVGVLLGYVGAFFNWIVVITVFQFGAYFGNSVGLLTAWGILRDIGNILLLFGFIYMGIIMILDLHSIDTRKAIPMLIVVAVLLNFSLFAAEAVIDVSNVLSAALYNQAGSTIQQSCTQGDTACATATATNQGIAGEIMNAAGLNTIFTQSGGISSVLSGISGDPVHQMFVYIGLTIFMTVTMVVMLAACIMLIIRGVTLTFVMVLAPIGFAAMAIPFLSGLGDQWRKALFSQSFFAPVYLLLVFVSLKIMEAVKTSLSGASANATLVQSLTNANTSITGIVIIFALIIGFMIAALVTAKNMGAYGADLASKTAGGLIYGGAGFVGRRTVGRFSAGAGTFFRNSTALNKYAPDLARNLAGIADKGAHASFDVRSSKSVQGLLKDSKINLGTPGKTAAGGFHAIEEKATEARVKYAESLKERARTDKEWEAEKQKARETVTKAEVARDAAISEKQTAILNAATARTNNQTAYDTAKAVRDAAALSANNEETALTNLRARFAQNPTDAALESQVTAQEQVVFRAREARAAADKTLSRRESDLSSSEKSLTEANNALTKTRATEDKKVADLIKTYDYVDPKDGKRKGIYNVRGEISKKDRQLEYAEKIEHRGFTIAGKAITVGPHANHAAAKKIKGNASKSSIEKEIEKIRKDAEKEAKKAASGDDGHGEGHPAPAPTSTPAATAAHGPAHH